MTTRRRSMPAKLTPAAFSRLMLLAAHRAVWGLNDSGVLGASGGPGRQTGAPSWTGRVYRAAPDCCACRVPPQTKKQKRRGGTVLADPLMGNANSSAT